MKHTPGTMKWMINLYPPYFWTGIRVDYIREDWKEMRVSMPLRWYNRNIMGSHFGGSLYAMIDPHLMVLLIQLLGDEYIVWDRAARIDFIKAGRKKVSALMTVSDERLAEIRDRTAGGEKYLPEFIVDILDEDNELIARADKVLYVRKKRAAARPPLR